MNLGSALARIAVNSGGDILIPQGAIRSDVLATLVDWLRVKLR